jgi:TorA maturation chaperone TorD
VSASPITFESPRAIDVIDQARADYYALLSHLFYQAPDARLLHAIVVADPPEGELAASWKALAAAAAVVPEDAVREEYDALFIGVGKAPLMLYGSYFLAGFMMEKPLAELRTDLAELGFTRAPNVREPEDHLAALCDVMRALILGDVERPPAKIDAQQQFYRNHIDSWVFRCMSEISAYHQINFYKRVADFAQAFFAIETEAMKM